MPVWTPGQRLVVRYKNDQTLLSERIVLVHLDPAAASRFLLALPDLKIINGSMSVVPSESIDSMRLMKRRRVVFGVDGSDVCIIEDSQPRSLSPGEFRDLVDVAMMLAALTGGTVVADPPPAFPPAGAPPGLDGGLVAAALFGGAMAGVPVVAAAACPAFDGAGAGAPGLSAVALALKELLKEALASKERKEATEDQALATKGGKQ
jgi:hypothetical protein